MEHSQRDSRLDFAKALAISFVLLLHLQPFKIRYTQESSIFFGILQFEMNIFYYQISMIAIPLFFIISLYIFFQKTENHALRYFTKRVGRLTELYLFWTGCQFALFYGIPILSPPYGTFNFPAIKIPIHRLILEGGPPLPIVGGSVFYFIFILIVLVILSFVFLMFRNIKFLFPFFGITFVIIIIIYFEILSITNQSLPYWRLDNFLIYVPVAYFFFRAKPEKLKYYSPCLYILFIFFIVHDIYLTSYGYSVLAYSRISIILGAAAVFSSLLQLKDLKPLKLITFLSKFSLGIFAIHKILWLLVIVLAKKLALYSAIANMGLKIDLGQLIFSTIIISLTFLSVFFLGQTRLKRFLS